MTKVNLYQISSVNIKKEKRFISLVLLTFKILKFYICMRIMENPFLLHTYTLSFSGQDTFNKFVRIIYIYILTYEPTYSNCDKNYLFII